ncbi:flagellar basal-body MS-ring/collar protein FliF [Buchnera aphidicola]|nr:flagellar basal-body MS-ring/collar protein FliF [Buchnera aphidicola]
MGRTSNLNVKNRDLKRNFFSNLSLNVRVLLLVFLITLIVFYIFFFKPLNYSILYNNLSNDDEKSIVSRLISLKIPFKFNQNHSELLIPSNALKKVYLDLAEQGLPKEKKVGFELLDTEKFGLSQFNEEVNYERALEGELARSIQKLENIKTARVHIVLSKSSVFIREKKIPSASVILEIKPGRYLNYNQINSILHIVAQGVSNLQIENITIVDQFGNLLSSMNDLYNDSYSNNQLKYSNEIETGYKNKIESVLVPLVGVNNIHAQVTAQISFDKQENSEERFTPNYSNEKQSVRSVQNKKNIEFSEKYSDNSFSSNQGVLSNKKLNDLSNSSLLFNHNNIPNFSEQVSSTKNSKRNLSDESVIPQSSTNQNYIVNYELDHVISHNKFNVGNVKRLSVAVVINYVKDKHGKFVSLSTDKLNSIKKLVCESVGFSRKRGDSVSVVNFKFSTPEVYFQSPPSNYNKYISFNNLFEFFLICLGVIILCLLIIKLNFLKILFKNKKRIDISNNYAVKDNLTSQNKGVEDDKELKKKLSSVLESDPKEIAMVIRKWISG